MKHSLKATLAVSSLALLAPCASPAQASSVPASSPGVTARAAAKQVIPDGRYRSGRAVLRSRVAMPLPIPLETCYARAGTVTMKATAYAAREGSRAALQVTSSPATKGRLGRTAVVVSPLRGAHHINGKYIPLKVKGYWDRGTVTMGKTLRVTQYYRVTAVNTRGKAVRSLGVMGCTTHARYL